MKNYLFLSLFVLSALALKGQATYRECGTVSNPQWAARLQNRVASLQPVNAQKSTAIPIPYQIHLFQTSNGSSQLTLQNIYKEIDSVNVFYANANLFLFECAPPEYIQDDSLYDYDYYDQGILQNLHYKANVLNLYFPNTVSLAGNFICGYSMAPPSEDLAVVAATCATNGSTLAHEVGHYLGLLHSHEYGDELVDGSNCATAGDKICDTPADPSLYGNVAVGCTYTGTATDANGMPYMPDVTNIMSYSLWECRTSFTPMQYSLLNSIRQNERSNLTCSSDVGLQEQGHSLFSVFPNPGKESLSVSLKHGEESSFELYDVYGKRLLSAAGSATYQVDTRSLPAGIYVYRLKVLGNSYHGKWVKE